MAAYLFAKAIVEDRPIKVFNRGNMRRDFTYVDDIVGGVLRVLENPPESDSDWDAENPSARSSSAPYRIYNIGHSSPVDLMHFIEIIEKLMGKNPAKFKNSASPVERASWVSAARYCNMTASSVRNRVA